ncbi:hypothetical protein FRC07_013558 [Ceratobasidium sp. 392]|nr:hypothetical protein FRC07_013558 [Ceratobasidium sp. 392]
MPAGFLGVFKGFDGFGRTTQDAKLKTRSGAFLTVLSAAIVFIFTIINFIDYRRVVVDSLIIVDRSRGEKIMVKMDITFPRVPCYLLSLDATDISGETQQDISHNMAKTRLDSQGQIIHEKYLNNQLDNDVEKSIKDRPKGYCGSCYGAGPHGKACCQTCESVRKAYLEQGWMFENPEGIEQCVHEGWTAKIQHQSSEGCRIAGRVRVNKVSGNFHFSPGRSFIQNKGHVQDLVPYLKDGNRHDFAHHIREFHFEGSQEGDIEWRKKVGFEGHPLDDVLAHSEVSNYMFQYFMKVVSTEFKYLNGDLVRSHQYSVTSFERDLSHGDATERDSHGTLVGHNVPGLPGVFFNYDISPLMVVHRETRQTFAHFITSLCAVIGGVLTVATIADSVVFAAIRQVEGAS